MALEVSGPKLGPVACPETTRRLRLIGASMTRIGFWGPLYSNCKEPQSSIANHIGHYSRLVEESDTALAIMA